MFAESYIEKCKKAIQLQQEWKPKNGDWFFAEKAFWCVSNSTVDNQKISIWLPTQDQLISMCKNIPELKVLTEFQLLSRFRIDICAYCIHYLEMQTLNDMWLLFYMKKKYHRQWIPNKKEWR